MGNQFQHTQAYNKDRGEAQRAQSQKKIFQKDVTFMNLQFKLQICWWFNPKNINFEKELIKKLCSQNSLFLKLFKCILAHGSVCYMILIDGYVQGKGETFLGAMSQAIKLLAPIVLLQGFKIKQIMVFNPYGSFEYSFDDDVECFACCKTKSLGFKQNCCGKAICDECKRKNKEKRQQLGQKDVCCYCGQEFLLRDYPTDNEYTVSKEMITYEENIVLLNGVKK